jgi:hypothetical protein
MATSFSVSGKLASTESAVRNPLPWVTRESLELMTPGSVARRPLGAFGSNSAVIYSRA